ncbi:LOW QUALITY PROTEIN: hypothetical protein ACHAXR_005209 [Thalassiosira sp. AJA248-18]
MPQISAISYPTYDDLGHSVRQRVAGSVDLKKLGTAACSVLGCYIVFLLDGYTLKNIKVSAGTIRQYLGVVNKHYKEKGYDEPYDKDDDSNGAKLLRAQEKFEEAPAKRNPLTDKMIVKMEELSHEDPLGSRLQSMLCSSWTIWRLSPAGVLYGLKKMPDGTKVVRAFTRKNFIFYVVDGIIIAKPLANRELAAKIGTEYDIQKNRIVSELLPSTLVAGQNIVTGAKVLGNTKPEDPMMCLQGQRRAVLKLVSPNISEAELKLISRHSIRVKACVVLSKAGKDVKACVVLSEAGKDGPYIKLRLRWLSNCFEIYLRNTNTIATQHADALDNVHSRMSALARHGRS